MRNIQFIQERLLRSHLAFVIENKNQMGADSVASMN